VIVSTRARYDDGDETQAMEARRQIRRRRRISHRQLHLLLQLRREALNAMAAYHAETRTKGTR
jgi:hypothetical protein